MSTVKFSSFLDKDIPFVFLYQMTLTFLSRFQIALLWAGYTDAILKVKYVRNFSGAEHDTTDIHGYGGFTDLLFEFVLD